MARLGPFAQYLHQISAQLDIARWGSYQLDTLTPEVAHASAMLLGLALRADLNRPVIRQLVPLLDGKTQVLREALAYLERVDQDQAIEAIADCLDTEQLAFVLMQTQDVMLDVDEPTEAEQAVFDRLRARYDGSSALMSTSLVTIKHKNALSLLGPFELPEADAPAKSAHRKPAPMAPPQVLAESLLRITVADSAVDPQQLAYMGEVIARYPGLQNLAVRQARRMKTEQFILQVRGVLTSAQALCVLCQCAHLIFIEGRGSQPKWQVFRQLRDAWGLSERDMVVHLGTLKFNASRLLSRRDENAQPSAWGMRQDDWAAMKNGQGRPAAKGARGAAEEEGDVIRRSGDEGPGAAPQRPRGASAVHRGPVPAPRAAAPAAPASAPAASGAPAAAPAARKPAPSRPAASAPVPATAPAPVCASSAAGANAASERQAPANAPASAEPDVQSHAPQQQAMAESSAPVASAGDAQASMASDVDTDQSAPPMASDQSQQAESHADDASAVAQAAPSAPDASSASESVDPAQAMPAAPQEASAERTDKGGSARTSEEPSAPSMAAAEPPPAALTGAAPAATPAASPVEGAQAAATPAQAAQTPTATAAPSPASPVATPAGPQSAGGPTPAAASPAAAGASEAAHAPASPTAATPSDSAGQSASSAGQKTADREASPRADAPSSRDEPESRSPAADRGNRSAESASDSNAQADRRTDGDKSAGATPPQGNRQDTEGAHASGANAGAGAANIQQVPGQASANSQAVTAGPQAVPAVSPGPLSAESGSSPATTPQSSKGGAAENIQSVPPDHAGDRHASVHADDARKPPVPVDATSASGSDVKSGRHDLDGDRPDVPGTETDEALDAQGASPDQPNRVALPQDALSDRFEGVEPAQDSGENLISEDAATADHSIQLDAQVDDSHPVAIDESALEDNVQILDSNADDENRQLLDQDEASDNRQAVASEASGPNRQRVDLADGATDNRQRLPADPNLDKLLPELKPVAGRAIAAVPRREPEKVHTRVFESWQNVAQKEPEVVRKKAGFPSQIPPTIHRQRVIDFSSINVFLEYEGDSENDESMDGHDDALEKKRDYDYKLQTCLDILRQQQDLVNDKLHRVQTRR